MPEPSTEPLPLCSNCGALMPGLYCQDCGQKRLVEGDRRFGHLLGHLFEALTDVDSRLWRSLRALLLQPGRLSKEYIDGRRARWFPPIALFLMVNVVYFFVPPLSDFNLRFADQVGGELALASDANPARFTPEQREKIVRQRGQVHSDLTTSWVQSRIAERQAKDPTFTAHDYAQDYEKESANVSKLLIFLHIPFAALALALLFWHKRHYYAEYFVVSTHLLTWLMVFALLLVPVLKLLPWTALPISGSVKLVLALVPVAYIAFAFRRVYQSHLLYAISAAVVWFAALIATNVIPYRAIQFVLVNLLIAD